MELNRLFPLRLIAHTPPAMGDILERNARGLFQKAGDRLPEDIFQIGTNRQASVPEIIRQLEDPYLDLMQRVVASDDLEPIESKQLGLLNKITASLKYSSLWKTTSATMDEILAFSQKMGIPLNIAEIILRQKNHKDRYLGRDYDLSLMPYKDRYFKEWSDRSYKPVTGALEETEALQKLLKYLSPNAPTEMTDIIWREYPDNSAIVDYFSQMTPFLKDAPNGVEYPLVNSNGPHLHLHTASRIPNEPDLLMWTLYDNETLNAKNAILQQTQVLVDTKNNLIIVMQHASSQLPIGKDLSWRINPNRVRSSQLKSYIGELPVNHLGGIPYTLNNTQYEVFEVIHQRAEKLQREKKLDMIA